MRRNRMMADVAQADVVLVNPTHVAVALRYQPDKGAPRVVAKGADHVAARIRKLAEENRVPMVRDVPLARTLYKSCEVGQEIPPDLYRAVATVLAFIMTLRKHAPGPGSRQRPLVPTSGRVIGRANGPPERWWSGAAIDAPGRGVISMSGAGPRPTGLHDQPAASLFRLHETHRPPPLLTEVGPPRDAGTTWSAWRFGALHQGVRQIPWSRSRMNRCWAGVNSRRLLSIAMSSPVSCRVNRRRIQRLPGPDPPCSSTSAARSRPASDLSASSPARSTSTESNIWRR
jgi:type III secretion system FlhB-like substrate exporter